MEFNRSRSLDVTVEFGRMRSGEGFEQKGSKEGEGGPSLRWLAGRRGRRGNMGRHPGPSRRPKMSA